MLIGFDGDDLMNTYQAWRVPIWKLVLANLAPFTTVYRPVGSALYRVFFWFDEFHLLPMRILVYALLLLNIWLAFKAAHLLSESKEVGVIAALVCSYHKGFTWIYSSNGTIYDILCFSGFAAALCVYIAARQSGRAVTGWRLVWFLAAFVFALNSKEMAVTLPAVLLSYELLYWPLKSWKPWLAQRKALWISALITAISIVAKMSSESFAGVGGYAVTLSTHQYFSTEIPLLRELFMAPALNTFWVITILAALFALALALRNKTMILAAIMIVLLPLPINFIPYRGFGVMYLPYLGWALYTAALLVEIRKRLMEGVWKIPPFPPGIWGPDRIALFLFTLYFLWTVQIQVGFQIGDPSPDHTLVAELNKIAPQIHQDHPQARRIFFLNDGFDADRWDVVFLMRLTYHDLEATVDQAKKKPASGPYDVVIDYCNHQYLEVNPGQATTACP